MPFTAADVMRRAAAILQDGSSVRWPLPELLNWLNDGMRDMALLNPRTTAQTEVMPLVEGTRQTLPPKFHQLLEVIANDGPNPALHRAVTPIVKEIMDTQFPGWHSAAVMAFSPTVVHVCEDKFDARTFYVVPGNTGTGQILIVGSVLPEPIPLPANPLAIESYTAQVPVADIYQSALLDFVLARAFSKDINLAGAAQRAQLHMQLFQGAIGANGQNQAAMTVDTPGSRFSN